VKAAAAKILWLWLAVLLCAGILLIVESRPRRAVAESLQLATSAERDATGDVVLWVRWRWSQPAYGWGREQEHLLSVSFDTQTLALLAEEAPAGRGATGAALRRLEAMTGNEGARRLLVIPGGQDGYVRLQFRPKTAGTTRSAPFRIHVVFHSPEAGVYMTQSAVPSWPTEVGPPTGLPQPEGEM
jgi:hypothetical protein